MRLELACLLPPSVHMIQVPDGNLEEMLEELLEDVKLHKAKNGSGNGGNLCDTSTFSEVCRRFSTPGQITPSYKVLINEQRVQVESLRDFSGVDRVLSKYIVPPEDTPRSPEQNFSKRFKNSLDWKVQTQDKIVRNILECQREAIQTKDVHKLQPLTYDSIAAQVKVHETTANRLLKDMWISLEGRELKVSDFILNENSGLTQLQVQSYLLDISYEHTGDVLQDFSLSDQEITRRYNEKYQKSVSRRLVNKARNVLEKDFRIRRGTQKPSDHTLRPVHHWIYERPITEEEISSLVRHDLDTDDVSALSQGASSYQDSETSALWYHYLHAPMLPEQRILFAQEIDARAKKSGSYTSQDLDELKRSIEWNPTR